MKIARKIIFVAFLVACSTRIFSQSFDKHDVVIDAGADLGVYSAQFTDKVLNTIKNNSATSGIYSAGVEFGLLKWLGIGARFSFDNYLTLKDSSSGKSYNGRLFLNIHLVRRSRLDLLIGGSYGVSVFSYKNDITNVTANGNGPLADVYIIPRIYFGSHFGIFARLAYENFNYQSVTSDNTSILNNFSLNGGGVNIGVGIQLKL